ncbi:hypothetical protein ACFWPQ_42925 [Streptomyces sp. NPDC058464]|uniref:hypothetical protein n=1 Tax=Streptomyces sp. NPDC058464 TaxID=3346511 RepID=UPI003665FA6E
MLAADVPNLLIRTAPTALRPAPDLFGEVREGWREFRSHTWLWVIVLQYSLVSMACAWGYGVLGPVVARDSLDGSTAWGEILVAESPGLVVGACAATRFTTRRPMLFAALCGAAVAAPTPALALLLPFWLICAFSFGTGVLVELMTVRWNVVMARTIPADRPARFAAVLLAVAVTVLALAPKEVRAEAGPAGTNR